MQQFNNDYPELNKRATGWLNFLYQKATTSDDWSEDGDRTKTNKKTKVSVSNIPNTNQIEVFCDGKPFNDYSVDSFGGVVLNTEVANHLFHIRTGYILLEEQKRQMNRGIQYNTNKPSAEMNKGEGATTRLLVARPAPSLCGCC